MNYEQLENYIKIFHEEKTLYNIHLKKKQKTLL